MLTTLAYSFAPNAWLTNQLRGGGFPQFCAQLDAHLATLSSFPRFRCRLRLLRASRDAALLEQLKRAAKYMVGLASCRAIEVLGVASDDEDQGYASGGGEDDWEGDSEEAEDEDRPWPTRVWRDSAYKL